MLPVEAFRLVGVRQPGKDHHHLRLLGQAAGLHDEGLVGGVGDVAVTRRISEFQPPPFHLVQGVFQAGRIDQGAAAALVAGLLRQFADDRQLGGTVQGKDVVLVFQEHGALGGRFPGQGVVGLRVVAVARLQVLHRFLHQL